MTNHPPRVEPTGTLYWNLDVDLYQSSDGAGLGDYITELNHSIPGYTRRVECLSDESGQPGGREKFCSHYLRGSNLLTAAPKRYRLVPKDTGLYYLSVDVGPNLNWFWPGSVLGPLEEPIGDKFIGYGLPMLYAESYGFRTVSDPSELYNLRARGFAAMLPDIKPDLSFINSILELRDFKTLPHTLRNVVNLTKDLTRKWGAPARKTIRRWLRGGSDAHLQYAFGIGPLISDILGVKKALSQCRFALIQVKNRRGIPQRHHYACPLNADYIDRRDVQSYVPPWGQPTWVTTGEWRQVRTCTYRDASFHMTLDYIYDIVGIERELTAIDVLLDRLGINVNPAIVWNAIPWTFVVDWLASVSNWLEQFALRHVRLRTVITDCSWSISVDRMITCELIIAKGDAGGSTFEGPVSYVHEKAYKRVPWTPDGLNSLRVSGLSSREASLLYSLFAVRLKR